MFCRALYNNARSSGLWQVREGQARCALEERGAPQQRAFDEGWPSVCDVVPRRVASIQLGHDSPPCAWLAEASCRRDRVLQRWPGPVRPSHSDRSAPLHAALTLDPSPVSCFVLLLRRCFGADVRATKDLDVWVSGTTCTETKTTQCGRLGGVPFGFHSAYKSPAHGLLYFRNRWYSVEAGQWLTQDPLGEVDSVNLYAFNRFDSVNFVDPWGLEGNGAADIGPRSDAATCVGGVGDTVCWNRSTPLLDTVQKCELSASQANGRRFSGPLQNDDAATPAVSNLGARGGPAGPGRPVRDNTVELLQSDLERLSKDIVRLMDPKEWLKEMRTPKTEVTRADVMSLAMVAVVAIVTRGGGGAPRPPVPAVAGVATAAATRAAGATAVEVATAVVVAASGIPDDDERQASDPAVEPSSSEGKLASTNPQKSIDSLRQNIKEHQEKLNEYLKNPDAFDNQGLLRNAPTPEVRQRIIDGRVRHLEKEIQTFEKNIRDLGGVP